MEFYKEKGIKLLTNNLFSFVTYPDKLEVWSEEQEDLLMFYIKVDKRDMGWVIGKQGIRIIALKQILWAAMGRDKIKSNLFLIEPD
jgi:predicted RNA-binding protein YlqC (UPF0109 family)